jgi:rod shape determining protein RodA
MWSRLKTFDPFLFIVPIVLSAISLIFIYILTYDRSGTSLAFRQGIFVGVGFLAMGVLTFVDYRAWRAWRWWLYALVIALLIATIFFGTKVFGATSWINIGPFQFQPSEVAKIVLIVVLASVLQTRGSRVKGLQFWFAVVLFLIPLIFIMLQPDFGTTLIIAVMGLGIFMHARLYLWQRAVLMLVVALACSTLFLSFHNVGPFAHVLKDYQKERLASFLQPENDPSGTGYNVVQSKIAVGSGGLLGRGLGYGSQSQLNFLPVVHTDFIFAAIAEAWGMVGSYGLLLLFGVLIIRLLNAARQAQDEFGYLVCIGLLTMILFQVLINVGMNVGIMPVTGIPLPFVSYGGTAFVTYCIGMGLAQAVVVRSKRLTF